MFTEAIDDLYSGFDLKWLFSKSNDYSYYLWVGKEIEPRLAETQLLNNKKFCTFYLGNGF